MWRLAASRRWAVPAPVAARSARCCRRRSERRGCHRESRTASSRRSQARRAPRQIPASAPAGWRRPRAAGLRAARPAAGAGRPARRFFRQGLRHWLRRTAGRRPDWPTGSACRRRSTARRAGGSPHRPPIADRSRPATEIPHPSSQPHDRPASGSAARMPKALSDRYYRKPAAAGPRPGGLAATLAMDNLNLAGCFLRAGPFGRPPRWVVAIGRQGFRMGNLPGAASVPERPLAKSGRNPCQRKGAQHERRCARPFRDTQGNAIDGGSELRAGPQDVREIRRLRAGRRRHHRGAQRHGSPPAPGMSAARPSPMPSRTCRPRSITRSRC